MVGTPRDMTLIIACFFAQNLPAKAVELMSNGFLLGWCQLQELFTSSHAPRGRLSSPFASIPNGRCAFGKVFGNIFEIFQKYFLDGGFWRIFRPEEFISMLERCSWVYGILPFPPFLKNWKPDFRSWRRSPAARKEVPYKAKRQKHTAQLCVFAFLISVAALTAKKAPMPLCLM